MHDLTCNLCFNWLPQGGLLLSRRGGGRGRGGQRGGRLWGKERIGRRVGMESCGLRVLYERKIIFKKVITEIGAYQINSSI